MPGTPVPSASDDVEQPAPYPLLVTIGTGDDGHIWLLNLEGLGVIDVVGDRTYGDDLLRYVGAELAVNPWSRDVMVACVGAATEVAPMNAERIRTFDSAEAAAAEMRTEAEATIARAREVGAIDAHRAGGSAGRRSLARSGPAARRRTRRRPRHGGPARPGRGAARAQRDSRPGRRRQHRSSARPPRGSRR